LNAFKTTKLLLTYHLRQVSYFNMSMISCIERPSQCWY